MIKIIKFNFNKINVEKTSDSMKDLKINTKIDISSIEEIKSEMLKGDEKLIKVNFLYGVEYNPKIANIVLEGNIILALNKEESKKVLASWKDKKMSESFRISIFNFILKKANVKALGLEEEMNLPYHIPFPTLKAKKEEKK